MRDKNGYDNYWGGYGNELDFKISFHVGNYTWGQSKAHDLIESWSENKRWIYPLNDYATIYQEEYPGIEDPVPENGFSLDEVLGWWLYHHCGGGGRMPLETIGFFATLIESTSVEKVGRRVGGTALHTNQDGVTTLEDAMEETIKNPSTGTNKARLKYYLEPYFTRLKPLNVGTYNPEFCKWKILEKSEALSA